MMKSTVRYAAQVSRHRLRDVCNVERRVLDTVGSVTDTAVVLMWQKLIDNDTKAHTVCNSALAMRQS